MADCKMQLKMSAELDITWMGELLTLLPERAIYWSRTSTLLLADVHLGKASTLQAAGIPVPEGNDVDDLKRLASIFHAKSIERVVVLGDWIHAQRGIHGRLIETVERWRAQHAQLTIDWVPGNHDRKAADLATAWNMRLCDAALVNAPFVFQHYPIPSAQGATIAGHLHPCFSIQVQGNRVPRMPCFVFQPNCAILPAFGSFVGASLWKRMPGEKIYLVVEDKVMGWNFS